MSRAMSWSLVLALAASGPACVDDPFDLGAPRSCDIEDQNEWVLKLLRFAYLWNDELPDVDPASFDSPGALVNAVRYAQHDTWSLVANKAAADTYYEEGKFIGLGFRTVRDLQDRVRIAFVHGGSPAELVGMVRGDVVDAVGGNTVEALDMNGWGGVYGPNEPGVAVEMTFTHADGTSQTETLTKDWVQIVTVPVVEILDTPAGPVGYFLMDSFVEPGTSELKAAFETLGQAGVRDLVVDLRYNRGGLLAMARTLASLMAGPEHAGDVFYRVQHNDNLAAEDWNSTLKKVDEALDLDRVVFITTGVTLSASEVVISGLAPYVDTSIVGSPSGGKPVGSLSWSFCEQTVFPVTFRNVNAEGFTDYFEGLTPNCPAADDLLRAFGDPEEASLAEALHLLTTGSCTTEGKPAQVSLEPSGPRRDDGLDGLAGSIW